MGTCFITNPPWDRKVLHPIIQNLSSQHPTWLLFDADWMHTRQAASLIIKCWTIISVGRVKWIPDSPFTGKDNCCWYLFRPDYHDGPKFHGRTPTINTWAQMWKEPFNKPELLQG